MSELYRGLSPEELGLNSPRLENDRNAEFRAGLRDSYRSLFKRLFGESTTATDVLMEEAAAMDAAIEEQVSSGQAGTRMEAMLALQGDPRFEIKREGEIKNEELARHHAVRFAQALQKNDMVKAMFIFNGSDWKLPESISDQDYESIASLFEGQVKGLVRDRILELSGANETGKIVEVLRYFRYMMDLKKDRASVAELGRELKGKLVQTPELREAVESDMFSLAGNVTLFEDMKKFWAEIGLLPPIFDRKNEKIQSLLSLRREERRK